ncbi:hypothetical protein FXW78_25240 [Rhodococcus opacus]|nr:hypothetical protein [Rhodococcus opacus]
MYAYGRRAAAGTDTGTADKDIRVASGTIPAIPNPTPHSRPPSTDSSPGRAPPPGAASGTSARSRCVRSPWDQS